MCLDHQQAQQQSHNRNADGTGGRGGGADGQTKLDTWSGCSSRACRRSSASSSDPLPPHLIGPRFEDRRELSNLFGRMCDQVQQCTILEQWAEVFHYTKSKHAIFYQKHLSYPTAEKLADIPRTWYAFVFDVLGGPRLLEKMAAFGRGVVAEARWLRMRVQILALRLFIFALQSMNLVLRVARMILNKLMTLALFVLAPFLRLYRFIRPPVPARECIICCSELSDEEAAVTLDCHGRDMHLHCLLQWTRTKNDCPICRGALPLDLEG